MSPHRTIGRLKRTEEFRRVYRDGTRRAGALVVVHSCPNGLPSVRLGVSVSRRFGRAAQRNRLRRRLREAVRWHRPRMISGVDLVVVPRPTAAEAPYADIRDGVMAVLKASGVLTATETAE